MELTKDQEKELKNVLNKKKGMICKEFQKVCPTEGSFDRMVKESHNVFDSLEIEFIEMLRTIE
jgi:hypothetical protein